MTDQLRQQIVFGRPDFWPKVVEKHILFLEKSRRLEQAVASLVDPARESIDHNQHLIIVLLQLVVIGMNEVITLVGNGMGHGAMKIVRGMVENSINAEYIRLFPEEGEKYLEWRWVELHKQINKLRATSPELAAAIPTEKLAEFEADYDRVKSLFIYKVANCDGTERTVKQESWCRDNLFQRAEKTGAAQTYMTVMPWANQILHGTVSGWLAEIDAADLRIEYPPTERWGGEALIAGHLALIQAIEAAGKALSAAPNPTIADLEADFQEVWHQDPKPQQTVGTQDPDLE